MTSVIMVLTCFFHGVELEICDCHCSTDSGDNIKVGTVPVPGSCDTPFSTVYLPLPEKQRCMQGIQCNMEDLYPIAINDKEKKHACLCVSANGVFDHRAGCRCDPMVEHNADIVNCVDADGNCTCSFAPTDFVQAFSFKGVCDEIFDSRPESSKCIQNIKCDADDLYDITGMKDTCLCNAASLTDPTVCECRGSVQREGSVMCSCEERITTLKPSTEFVSIPPTRSTPFQDQDTPFTTNLAGTTICDNCTGTGTAEDVNKDMNGLIIGVIFAVGLVLGMVSVIFVIVICRTRKNSKNGKSSGQAEISNTNAIRGFKGNQYSTTSNDNEQAEIHKAIESYSSNLTPMKALKPTAPTVSDGQRGGTNTYTYIDINVPSSGADQANLQNPTQKQLGLEGKYAQVNANPLKYDYVELPDGTQWTPEKTIPEQEFKYDYVGIVRQGDVQESGSPYDGLNRVVSPPPKSPTYLGFDYGHLGVANSANEGSPYDQVNRDAANEKSTNEGLELPEAQDYGRLVATSVNNDGNTYNQVNHGERRKPSTSFDESEKYEVLKNPTSIPEGAYAHFNHNNDLKSKDIDSPMLSYSEPYNQVNLVSDNTSAEYSQLHH